MTAPVEPRERRTNGGSPTWSPRLLRQEGRIERGYVPVAEIRVFRNSTPGGYQRELDALRVEHIVAEYDEHLFGTLEISRRKDGSFWCLDGQHRLAAARRLGHEVVPATVHYDLTPDREAYIFDHANSDRRALHMWDRFQARRAYADPSTVEAVRILEAQGFHLDRSGGSVRGIAAVGAVATIHRWGGTQLLSSVLSSIAASWRTDPKATDAIILRGLAIFLSTWPRHDHNRLLEVMAANSPIVVAKKAQEIRVLTGKNMTPGLVAVVLRDLYNGRRREGKRLTGEPTSPTSGKRMGWTRA